MSSDLVVGDIESYCGFCGTRVSADLESRRKHMFGCKKHPAFELGKRYHAIAEVIVDFRANRIDDVDALARIERIISKTA